MINHEKLHEECGVFGIFRRNGGAGVVEPAYHALYALQHRGQEACGIAVNIDGVISCHKDTGLVNDVFTKDVLAKIPDGNMAVGHCRYATVGTQKRSNAQPLLINHYKGRMAVCHNGNITNANLLRAEFEKDGAIFHTTSDTEVIAYVITQERIRSASIEEAVSRAMKRLMGAYCLIIMSPTKLIAARDPYGIRPLCMGEQNGDPVFASESCALDAIGASFVRDIRPGEIVVVNSQGVRTVQNEPADKKGLCIFEFIYFARPDSVIDGSSVHTARLRAGAYLAKEHPAQADVVIGVPDSGIDAAIGYARESGIAYGVGFVKNRYIGRTFIQPTQKQRSDSVRIKLNVIADTVRGKRVVLIDDSIVRGTTSARIVKILREAGATEVHMRLSSPPFVRPCYFGTDIDSTDNLIAFNHSVSEICKMIGADSLGFLNVDVLDKLTDCMDGGFCKGCFTGEYPEEIPEVPQKNKFEERLSQKENEQ